VLLLDTHVAVWLVAGRRELGLRSRRRLDRALAEDKVSLSAFSFWEIATLIARGRLRGISSADKLRDHLVGSGVREIPVDGSIAIAAARFGAVHGDPADRIIVATALEHAAILVTGDRALLELPDGPKTIDARR
jgi:PIN domain nuclease of toxin-antitoxin system